jgi:hypothetical protein
MEVDEIAQPLGEIDGGTTRGDFGIAARLVRIQRDEDIRRAVPPVLVVTPRGRPGTAGNAARTSPISCCGVSSTHTTAVPGRGSVVYS